MEKLLQTIIEELVDNRDAVEIEKVESSSVYVFEIKVAPEDVGKVIGKSGRTATAIRTIIISIARKHGKDAIVKFNDRENK
ncbi:KH domain-containing protein [bacterium]|nr:KH domain-containing protein [bacterium]